MEFKVNKEKMLANGFSEVDTLKCEMFRQEISRIVGNGCKSGNHFESDMNAAMYLISKAGTYNDPISVTLEDVLSHDNENTNIADYIRENFSEERWNGILRSALSYGGFDYYRFLDFNEDSDRMREATPESICRLAAEIMDVKDGERIADICCGYGTFLYTVAEKRKDVDLYGYEMNTNNKAITDIKCALKKIDATIIQGDIFSLIDKPEVVKKESFDKVFSNYPFGMRLKHNKVFEKYVENLEKRIPRISRATSADWVFNSVLIDVIKPEGKALAITTAGSMFNTIDKPARKYFVENGFVEAIIALPAYMFPYTAIPTRLIVLSHGNKEIKFIDATEIYQSGRRLNSFSDEDIKNIVEAYREPNEFCKKISIEQVRENDYVLEPSRFLARIKEYENGVVFSEVIKSISRGAALRAKELDDLSSEAPTPYQYLWLKNINDGIIDDELPYMTDIEEKLNKYCLKDKDLILSKNGSPYKVAVAQIKDGQKILASGNLYIIELDREKANPYYIKAFFESEEGNALLESISVGATIPNIGVESLKKIKIPLPSVEEQEKIARRYQAALDEISILRMKMERVKTKLRHIIDEESEV